MILIDTGPLVALCDARDSLHRKAAKHLEALAGDKFAVCEAVLVEACFHLPHRAARERLRALLDHLDVTTLPGSSDAAFRDDVFDWLIKYADHEPDWADGCIAVLSGRSQQLEVWTYDIEFRTTWRRPNASRIPMAAT